jgi:hypothetical protein
MPLSQPSRRASQRLLTSSNECQMLRLKQVSLRPRGSRNYSMDSADVVRPQQRMHFAYPQLAHRLGKRGLYRRVLEGHSTAREHCNKPLNS